MQLLQDLHTVDLEDFKYSEVRIIGLQLVDPNSEEYQDAGRTFKVSSNRQLQYTKGISRNPMHV